MFGRCPFKFLVKNQKSGLAPMNHCKFWLQVGKCRTALTGIEKFPHPKIIEPKVVLVQEGLGHIMKCVETGSPFCLSFGHQHHAIIGVLVRVVFPITLKGNILVAKGAKVPNISTSKQRFAMPEFLSQRGYISTSNMTNTTAANV